jgi:hypothetical protein
VSVSICGGLIFGGVIFGRAYSRRFTVYIYSFTSIANQKSVRYSVSISYVTNIAVQNVIKVCACAQEWTSSLNVWLEFLSKGTFAPPPLLKGKGGGVQCPSFPVSLEITTTELCTYQCFPPERGGVEAIQGEF